MVGMLDTYTLAGVSAGLHVAVKMAQYHYSRAKQLIEAQGQDHWVKTLDTEFGGMNDVMYRMYRMLGEPWMLELAQLFDKPSFYQPLVEGRDPLPGIHANTHLAQVNGFVARYEATNDSAARAAVTNFFNTLVNHHSYATGGSNCNEFWGPPDQLGDTLVVPRDAAETEETCTQYNVLKIARSLFQWTGDPSLLDFYERAILNGIIGVSRMPADWVQPPQASDGDSRRHHHDHSRHHGHSHLEVPEHQQQWAQLPMAPQDSQPPPHAQPSAAAHQLGLMQPHRRWRQPPHEPDSSQGISDAPGAGVYLYLLPLGAGVTKADSVHHWGTPLGSFWCCYGTAVESFAKLADSIYFRQGPGAAGGGQAQPPVLYVAQWVSSALTWPALGMGLSLQADMYGKGATAAASLTITASPANSTTFTLRLRIPGWASAQGASVVVAPAGGAASSGQQPATPGTFFDVTRQWRVGDTVSVALPMRYWVKELPESRPDLARLKAIMMGPYVMAGLTHDTRVLVADPQHIERYIAEPPPSDTAVTLQCSALPAMHLRHDQYHAYGSLLEDGADALDAAWLLHQGCGSAGSTCGRQPEPPTASSSITRRLLSGAEDGDADANDDVSVSLESLGQPGMFLTVDRQGVVVLQRAAAGVDGCRRRLWRLRRGLDGGGGSVSLEAAALPGHWASLWRLERAVECMDHAPDCAARAASGQCAGSPHAMSTSCRASCGECSRTERAARVLDPAAVPAGELGRFRAASSFALRAAATRLPRGSKVVCGGNRDYVISPLGNIVEERYTAYFEFDWYGEAAQAQS